MKQNAFVEKVARTINKMGLSSPAIILVEAHKPFAFLGSQLLLVAQPTLNLFLAGDITQNAIDLLADPVQVEQLLTHLESYSRQSPPLPMEETGL